MCSSDLKQVDEVCQTTQGQMEREARRNLGHFFLNEEGRCANCDRNVGFHPVGEVPLDVAPIVHDPVVQLGTSGEIGPTGVFGGARLGTVLRTTGTPSPLISSIAVETRNWLDFVNLCCDNSPPAIAPWWNNIRSCIAGEANRLLANGLEWQGDALLTLRFTYSAGEEYLPALLRLQRHHRLGLSLLPLVGYWAKGRSIRNKMGSDLMASMQPTCTAIESLTNEICKASERSEGMIGYTPPLPVGPWSPSWWGCLCDQVNYAGGDRAVMIEELSLATMRLLTSSMAKERGWQLRSKMEWRTKPEWRQHRRRCQIPHRLNTWCRSSRRP